MTTSYYPEADVFTVNKQCNSHQLVYVSGQVSDEQGRWQQPKSGEAN